MGQVTAHEDGPQHSAMARSGMGRYTASLGSSLDPTTVTLSPIWTLVFTDSTGASPLPLAFQPKEPVLNSRGSMVVVNTTLPLWSVMRTVRG